MASEDQKVNWDAQASGTHHNYKVNWKVGTAGTNPDLGIYHHLALTLGDQTFPLIQTEIFSEMQAREYGRLVGEVAALCLKLELFSKSSWPQTGRVSAEKVSQIVDQEGNACILAMAAETLRAANARIGSIHKATPSF